MVTAKVAKAFELVRREDFVPKELREEAGGDYPLPIGAGQTISQPFTVRFMLELLDTREGQKVLDVGSGSGWTTALLAYLVGPTGQVIGVERVPELVRFGRENLAKYPSSSRHSGATRGKPRARIEQAGAELGWPSEAPYDRILVSAAANELPQALLDQLTPSGIMVSPIGNAIEKITKMGNGSARPGEANRLKRERHEGFVFVPLIET